MAHVDSPTHATLSATVDLPRRHPVPHTATLTGRRYREVTQPSAGPATGKRSDTPAGERPAGVDPAAAVVTAPEEPAVRPA